MMLPNKKIFIKTKQQRDVGDSKLSTKDRTHGFPIHPESTYQIQLLADGTEIAPLGQRTEGISNLSWEGNLWRTCKGQLIAVEQPHDFVQPLPAPPLQHLGAPGASLSPLPAEEGPVAAARLSPSLVS